MSDIFVLHEGIKGNVTAEGFADHYKAESFSLGIARNLSMTSGATGNRESEAPTLSEVTLTKLADNSATELFKDAVGGSKGSQGKQVEIKFVQTGTEGEEVFLTYTLQNAMVSSYSVTSHGSDTPCETITLSYTEIECRYSDYDEANNLSSPTTAGFNISLGKAF